MLSVAYKTTDQGPSEVKVTQNSRETSGMAVAPKADRPAEKEEAKSGANDPASGKIAEPAPAKVGKPGNPAMEKSMVPQPAGNIAVPAPVAEAAKTEKPAAAAKPEATEPKANASKVPPAIKMPKPAPEQKAAAKAAKKPREYKVVAASYSTEAGTGELVNRLKAENYSPTVVRADLPKGRYYRVIVGSHGSLSEAHVEMAELKKLGLQPFCIVE